MSFKNIVIEASKSLNEPQLEKLYHNISNPYDNVTKKISGVEYSKLDDADVKAGTMFFALNASGKRVTYRTKTNIRAKKVLIDGKDYVVTNQLNYPGKKYIKELMIARV